MLSRRPATLRRRRARCRGGAVLLVVAASATTLLAGMAAAVEGAAAAAGQRAASAADASAHAAAVALGPGEARDALSASLQAGVRPCQFPYPREAPAPPSPDTAEERDTDACQAAFNAARSAAKDNGAALVFFVLGPDLRDAVPGVGTGRIQVIVHVAVPRRLFIAQRVCPDLPGDGGGLCWAEATAAAQRRWR
ncbi:MAG TPA: hypothetical protein VG266_04160 [Candidatus Dormibacteraeota bacterium]|nr:hypothetical protein [Candidatus Dormibacteraeota bacterium]